MKFKLQETPTDLSGLKSDCLIIPVYTDKTFSKAVSAFDKSLDGLLAKVIKSGDFSPDVGHFMLIPLPASATSKRAVLLGCGSRKKQAQKGWRKIAAKMFSQLQTKKIKSAHLLLEGVDSKAIDVGQLLQDMAKIGTQSTYKYVTTLSKKDTRRPFASLTVLGDKFSGSSTALRAGKSIGMGVNTARELGNLPANICTPRYLASEAQKLGRKHDKMKVSVLEDKKLETLGMGSLLSVARGSKEPARLISMEYKGGSSKSKPVVLVGKGITFDTGGISLKPGAAMDEMKYDMCGAASVFGVMTALAEMKAKVNVVGMVAAAENMPGSQATKPGDVVTSMSGKTIEVLNTDAEGRLVLCDALTYAERFNPAAVIDIATLTGACVVALGHHASGLFSNNDKLANELLEAGEYSGDRAWRLPIWSEYQEQLKSNFADLANIGGRSAGSITAACFLANFTEEYAWAHLDIAGTAWTSGASKGATGAPVPLLMSYILQQGK